MQSPESEKNLTKTRLFFRKKSDSIGNGSFSFLVSRAKQGHIWRRESVREPQKTETAPFAAPKNKCFRGIVETTTNGNDDLRIVASSFLERNCLALDLNSTERDADAPLARALLKMRVHIN